MGGFLGDVPELSEFKRQMLENVAPVNQRAALDALLRAVTHNDFVSISNSSRVHFARLLRSLAYEQDLFEEATTALSLFALKEPDDQKSDSIREILQSLFYIHLSGTQALPEQRAAFVRTLALSNGEGHQKLALILLRAGLESQHFSCNFSFEFGARRRDYGWYPKNLDDIQQWYGLFVRIAVNLGKSATETGADARSLLGGVLRSLWTDAHMGEVLTVAARELAAVGGWPDGWIGIRNTLHLDKQGLDENSLVSLKALEKELAPRNLLAKIQAKVLSRGTFGVPLDDESEADSVLAHYDKAQEEARELGRAAALDDTALADLTPYISKNKSTDKSWNFGFGIGQEAKSTREILDRIQLVLREAKSDGLNSVFVRGLVAGWNKTNAVEVSAFLDSAINDEVWGPMFPELQVSIPLDNAAHARLIKSLGFGNAPSRQFQYLGMGRVTDALTIEQVASIMALLAVKPDDGLAVAIDVLGMVIFCLDNKSAEYRSELQSYCSRFIGEIDWVSIDLGNANFEHHLEVLIEFALAGSTKQEESIKALKRLVQFACASTKSLSPRMGKILTPFFKHCPEEALSACYVQDSDGSYRTAFRMLLDYRGEFGDTAVVVVPENVLINWCKSSSDDRCLFAAQTCKLCDKSKAEGLADKDTISISSIAKSILAISPNKKKIIEIFIGRLRPNHWSGSLVAIMRQRLQLLDELNPTKDEELRPWIEDAKERFSKVIANEEKREQDQERSRTGSFE